MGQKLDRADILEMMLETFEAAQQGRNGAEALTAFATRGQPPEDRAAGRTHETRIWATDDVFTALTTEARERVRIPIYSGRALRHEAGRRYDLMSATIPI